MALQTCGLNVNGRNKELQPHGSSVFPCAAYASFHSDSFRDFIPWHWHEDFEIVRIIEGTLKLRVSAEIFSVHAGEIAVINANTLHAAAGDPYCALQSLVFSPLLITGHVHSAFSLKYIAPLISNTHFSAILLSDQTPLVSTWFSDAFEALKNDAFAYEFTVREQLSHIMLTVYAKLKQQPVTPKTPPDTSTARAAAILSFLEEHYSENILLSDIAEAVHISERELLRCFRKVIGESPMQFLLKYRLMQSASMLKEFPDKSISLVAEECGFASPAYYAKKFREYYLCSPRAYRKTCAV